MRNLPDDGSTSRRSIAPREILWPWGVSDPVLRVPAARNVVAGLVLLEEDGSGPSVISGGIEGGEERDERV